LEFATSWQRAPSPLNDGSQFAGPAEMEEQLGVMGAPVWKGVMPESRQ